MGWGVTVTVRCRLTGKVGGGCKCAAGKASPLPKPRASMLIFIGFPRPLPPPRPAMINALGFYHGLSQKRSRNEMRRSRANKNCLSMEAAIFVYIGMRMRSVKRKQPAWLQILFGLCRVADSLWTRNKPSIHSKQVNIQADECGAACYVLIS